MRIKFYVFLLIFSKGVFSASFAITSQTVPPTVPEFGKTTALFLIKNSTNATLNGNFIKNLPSTMSQTTCDPNYCGDIFDLGPSGSATESCLLKLTVKGPVNSEAFTVCTEGELSCEVSESLVIGLGNPSPFIGVGAGSFIHDNLDNLPLLAVSNNTGQTWSYPSFIFQNLISSIDPSFTGGEFLGASCTGSGDKGVCIASGYWCKGIFCGFSQPLIAVGKQNGTQWTYPNSVYQNLQTQVDPNLESAYLQRGTCFGSGGNATCIVPGIYNTSNATFPLLALTSNGGSHWTYPTSIHQDLTTTVDPNFTGGQLNTASCTKDACSSTCIAAGFFCKSDECNMPFLALSRDKGNTWTFPHAIFENLNTKIDPAFLSAAFDASSCVGGGSQAICIAAGNYSNGPSTFPILALTQDSGVHWDYPEYIFKNLTVSLRPDFKSGSFQAASCTGTGNKLTCIAAGSFYANTVYPFIAVTRDKGTHWIYPRFIFTKLKVVVDPNFREGSFNGASCTGTGSNAICIAAGYYCHPDNKCFPLIAASIDSGKSWTYPSSVYSNPTLSIDPTFQSGSFEDVSCKGTAAYNFCIATGFFSTSNNITLPLVALSTDKGQTWIYPKSIFQNIRDKIPGLLFGFLNRAATNGGEFKRSLPHPKVQKSNSVNGRQLMKFR